MAVAHTCSLSTQDCMSAYLQGFVEMSSRPEGEPSEEQEQMDGEEGGGERHWRWMVLAKVAVGLDG